MHKSVLSNELIEKMGFSSGDKVVDGTVNGGGHASMICKIIGPKGVFIGIDLDQSALKKTKHRIEQCKCKKHLIHDNFRNLDDAIKEAGLEKVNKIYLDLGLSSNQLEHSERGFSFRSDEPLIMTFDENTEENLTAFNIVNEWEEERIADVIFAYGEEPLARRIARAITRTRLETPIETTSQLANIVDKAVPAKAKRGNLHPARKTFQALRIAVNDELESLREALEKAKGEVAKEGVIGVISFHGLEDKIVKNFLKKWKEEEVGEILTKKPIKPSEEEIKENPRASSAKLRVFKKK